MAQTAKPRIVSLAPSATRTLWELGAAEHLAGVTRWCKDVVPAEAIAGLPVVGDCWDLDAQAVAKLKPDLVIGSVPYRAEAVEGILKQGLRFLAKSPRTLDDIYGDIRLLSQIVCKTGEGEKLAAKMQTQIAAARERTAAMGKRPRVYCEVWPNPLRSSERWVEELVEAAGGKFVPCPAGRQVSAEEVIGADPEIIVLAWAATGSRARADVVRRRPGWEQVSAVRNHRIHVFHDETLNTPAPILLEGLQALAAAIHPGSFS
ncbi:MAG TPA: helical backbone metal receptor [Terriglobia bacterium]|nr:helical backbone metal receptor [Terriglobia bacterium]